MAKAKTTIDDRVGKLRWSINVDKFVQEPYVVVPLLSTNHLRKVAKHARNEAEYGNCVVKLGTGTDKDQAFLNDDWQWLTDIVGATAQVVNDEEWHFHLWGIVEPLRIIRYEVGQHHAMHHDYNTLSSDYSKVSVTVLLNNSFEGGQLRFLDLDDEDVPELRAGYACFFPSWRAHEVTPVTKGTRLALAGWVAGPPFI